MRPRNTRFWMPLGRLGAFCVAVVVGINLLLHALRLPVELGPVGRRTDFLSRQKKKLEKRWRIFERFLRRAFSTPGPDARVAPPARFLASLGPDPALFEPLDPGFTWPRPLPVPVREIDLPLEGHGLVEPIFGPSVHEEWARAMKVNTGLEVGDAIFGGPEALLDGMVSAAMEVLPKPSREGPGAIVDRVLDLRMNPREGSFTAEFLERLADREQKYFASFADSGLDSFAFRDGEAHVDTDRLLRDQGKLAWDALRKTYTSKFDYSGEEAIRDDAFHFLRWRGLDYLALPPLMAGYFYYRGLDKTFSVGSTDLRVGLEPLRLWMRGDGDLVAGLTVEWRPEDWPVAFIMTAGRYDGRFEVEFVGIGTSAGMAIQALGISD